MIADELRDSYFTLRFSRFIGEWFRLSLRTLCSWLYLGMRLSPAAPWVYDVLKGGTCLTLGDG